jgi:hypothetical protein
MASNDGLLRHSKRAAGSTYNSSDSGRTNNYGCRWRTTDSISSLPFCELVLSGIGTGCFCRDGEAMKKYLLLNLGIGAFVGMCSIPGIAFGWAASKLGEVIDWLESVAERES